MPKIRTVKEWFDKLNPSLRNKAIKNTKDQFPRDLKDKKAYFSDAIDMFIWESTPEGYSFWLKIFNEAKKLERGQQEYYISVEYPFDFNFSLDKPIEHVAKNLKLEQSGSGSGLGTRDLSFIVNSSEKKINALVDKFRAKLKENVTKRIRVRYNINSNLNNI